ncbi:MAG: pentapeptide repeat-containing protein [Proteobacteria bacterium]|nr:pentapeptide repeat-containing protein [Pseudomonadota bacterium]
MSLINEIPNQYLSQHFVDLQLTQQKIVKKEFDNCTFMGSNFSETEFIQCKFNECHFINCNLSLIKVNKCMFFDTLFEESKLIGVNWTKATWPNIKLTCPIRFLKCIINDSSFMSLSIREISIVECKAHDVDFRDADCYEADFSHTDLLNSLFNNTNLSYANFAEAINYQINIYHNEIKGAKFNLPEAANLLRSLDIELLD